MLGAAPAPDTGPARAPGMLAAHYAPRARVEVCRGRRRAAGAPRRSRRGDGRHRPGRRHGGPSRRRRSSSRVPPTPRPTRATSTRCCARPTTAAWSASSPSRRTRRASAWRCATASPARRRPAALSDTDRVSGTSGNGRAPEHVRVAIVGAGFSGLGLAIRLREAGISEIAVLEKADEVGGTWRENTYPGVACDVPSHLYSLSFAPNPRWSRMFSPGPEIQDYLVALSRRSRRARVHQVRPRGDRGGLGLRRAPLADHDEQRRPHARRSSSPPPGPLHEPALPDVPGIEDFRGTAFHSATWDHDHDLTGERVAVVGTGASAIQFVPEIQPRVGAAHGVPAHAALGAARAATTPSPRARSACYDALPPAQARGARLDLRHRELRGARLHAPATPGAAAARGARRTCAARCPTPSSAPG